MSEKCQAVFLAEGPCSGSIDPNTGKCTRCGRFPHQAVTNIPGSPSVANSSVMPPEAYDKKIAATDQALNTVSAPKPCDSFTQFLQMSTALHQDCCDVLRKKRAEYVKADPDVYKNFRQAAGMRGVSMPSVLMGYLIKHLISLSDMSNSPNAYTLAMWREKLQDAINYLYLLNGMLRSEHMYNTDCSGDDDDCGGCESGG